MIHHRVHTDEHIICGSWSILYFHQVIQKVLMHVCAFFILVCNT